VQAGQTGAAHAVWYEGRWALVITRPLAVEGGSSLKVGEESYMAFAAWQGGKGEVGSRKSVTMNWLPLEMQ
jgi:DMSO reductase family type II enzyme heme b subunit